MTVNKTSVWKRVWRYRWFYLMLLPALVVVAIFDYGPMYGLQIAFRDYSISGGFFGSPWVGLKHFERIWADPFFWQAFKNTLIISVMKLVVGFPFPIILALLINEVRSRKASRTFQTIFTFPNFLSWIIVSGIILRIFSTQGLWEGFLGWLGVEAESILYDGPGMRWLMVFTEIWKGAGWSSIMYLAAIAGIDPALYESAVVDGAGRFQRMWYITLPGMKFTIFALLILSFGGFVAGNFDQIFNLYNPAVYSHVDIIGTYLYRISFEGSPQWSYSTAVGLFNGVINCILLLLANTLSKRFNEGSTLFSVKR